MGKNKFRFYMWLLQSLYESKGMTKQELKDLWLRSDINYSRTPISERSFFEYIKNVEEIFDVSIVCKRENGFRYRIEHMDALTDNEIKEWMLSSFAVHNTFAQSKGLRDRILCEVIPSGYDVLPTIINAMKSNCRLEMVYEAFYMDTPETQIVEPYCLKVFKRRWYMLAVEKGKKLVKIYALDRIKELVRIQETFNFPASFDANKYFHDSYGIIVDSSMVKSQTIQLKVYSYNNKDKYFRCLPLHHSQKEVHTCDDYTVFQYELKPTYDFYQEILSHGAEVEVVYPEEVRNICVREINRMMDVYQNPDKGEHV